MRVLLKTLIVGAALVGVLPRGAVAADGDTIATIEDRGYLSCGVTDSQFSFAGVDSAGTWTGFDVDFCRAVAAALLGDAQRVRFIQLGTAARFDALASGEVDVLFRNTTWTYGRDTAAGFDFAGITFFDTQGFLASTALGIDSVVDAPAGTQVCVVDSTTSQENLAEFITANAVALEMVHFDTFEGAHKAFFANRCGLYTSDRSALVSMKAFYPPKPDDYVILKETIAKEPLGPLVRTDDPRFADLIEWVVQATIAAEERGLSMANVDVLVETSPTPEVRRMLGIEPGIGAPLGLNDAWVRRIIAQVGNYGEIFERNLGPDTPMELERGLNALWRDGGLMYAKPFR